MWGGREGKSYVKASRDDGDGMEARRAPVNGVAVVGSAPCEYVRGGRPERFEKHVVCVARRKTGNVSESRGKRSRRPIRCMAAILA